MTCLCASCLDKKLQGCLNRKAIAENDKRQIIGELIGFKVEEKSLKVVIRADRHFFVLTNVIKLTFQDHDKEEIKLLEL